MWTLCRGRRWWQQQQQFLIIIILDSLPGSTGGTVIASLRWKTAFLCVCVFYAISVGMHSFDCRLDDDHDQSECTNNTKCDLQDNQNADLENAAITKLAYCDFLVRLARHRMSAKGCRETGLAEMGNLLHRQFVFVHSSTIRFEFFSVHSVYSTGPGRKRYRGICVTIYWPSRVMMSNFWD